MYRDAQNDTKASQTPTVWFGRKVAEMKFVSRSATCNAAFLSIHMRSTAILRLNHISEGGKLTQNRLGGMLNV